MKWKNLFRSKQQPSEPAAKRGLSNFEEFEGSDTSIAVKNAPHAPDRYLVTKEYGIPSVLINFESNFEQRILSFFEKAKPDEFNQGFLDATIQCLEAESLASLALQRSEHLGGQLPLISLTWLQGKTDYSTMKADLERELAEVEAEIRRKDALIRYGANYTNTNG